MSDACPGQCACASDGQKLVSTATNGNFDTHWRALAEPPSPGSAVSEITLAPFSFSLSVYANICLAVTVADGTAV